METITLTERLTYVPVTCYLCGVHFAMEAKYQQRRRDHGEDFYCPNGHSQFYTKSRVQELQEQLEAREKELRSVKCEVLSERQKRESAERKVSRVEKGVCPQCNRSFTDLRRHMQNKHHCK